MITETAVVFFFAVIPDPKKESGARHTALSNAY
jgi:hypothetical protein